MFTGIVSDVGTIEGIEERGDTRVTIACGYDLDTVELGASIACSGVCLTVVDRQPGERGGRFVVDVSGETIARTAADQWCEGRRLNLERALRVGDELGGHIVTGHVDGVGEVIDVADAGASKVIRFRLPDALAPFVAPKGSVTIDGVSLTVNDVRDDADATSFAINLIPHTQAVTTLGELAPGASVNLEIDVLARYLQRMEAYRGKR